VEEIDASGLRGFRWHRRPHPPGYAGGGGCVARRL